MQRTQIGSPHDEHRTRVSVLGWFTHAWGSATVQGYPSGSLYHELQVRPELKSRGIGLEAI